MREKIKQLLNWPRRHKWWTLAIVIVAIIILMIFGLSTKKSAKNGAFVTVDITRGDLEQVVSATGEISPVNTVSVGSQVSGTIEQIYADFNSQVKQGDILLTIRCRKETWQKVIMCATNRYITMGLLRAQKWKNHKVNMNRRNLRSCAHNHNMKKR